MVPSLEPVSPSHNDQDVLEAHTTGLVVKELDMLLLDIILFWCYEFLVEDLGKDIQEGLFTVPAPTMNMDMVFRVVMKKNLSLMPLVEHAACYIVTTLSQELPIPDTY